MIDTYKKLTIDFVRSPNSLHNSKAVLSPTNKTTNKPTNFTLIVQAREIPVNDNQPHHFHVNDSSRREPVWAIPQVAHIIKHNNIGSNKMYWFNVNNPTSETHELFSNILILSYEKSIINIICIPNKINSAENAAAWIDFVKSHTMRYDRGTIVAPKNVQNWNI